MKEYLVLGALCLSVSFYVLLSGCTMGRVSTQKETASQKNTIAFQETDKNCVKFRAKNGINTYIIKDGNGKIVGMRIAKEPLVNISVPRSYSDTKTSLFNQDQQQKVPPPSSAPRTFTGVKKAKHKFIEEKRETVLCNNRHEKSVVEKSPKKFDNDSDSVINTGAKDYSLRMDFPAKWIPGFVLGAMDLRNGGDFRFKIPVPGLDWDVKFGLKLKNKRLELSNNAERIVIGLFTISH